MAHHHHEHIHRLVRRQRGRQDDDDDDDDDREERGGRGGVATVVSVVVKTLPKTFDGDAVWITQAEEPKTMVGVPAPVLTSAAKDDDDEDEDQAPTTQAKATSARPASTNKETKSIPSEITAPTASPKSTATTLMVATSSPVVTGLIGAATGVSSPSASPTAAATSSGMSTGAKAGLALGILFVVGAILAGVLFLYSRKKKQDPANNENEKMTMQNAAPPPPPYETAPSIRTQRTMSTAPRLSLRPVTQFSPTFSENRKSGGNLLTVAAAAAPTSHSNNRSPSPDRPSSSWERPGASNATAAPQNPFNDPVSRSNTPPQDPFGNNAAIDTPQATAPSTPQYANHAAAPSAPPKDLANLAQAIAAAETAPMVMPAAPAARMESPAPPSVRSDMVPPSPAWTDDIPASPGPAPTGPPPIAVAGGSANGPALAPNNVHRVQLDFKPSMNDELGLRAGQLVRMIHEFDDGWALCARMDRAQQGVVPRTCLSKHPVKPRNGPPRQGPPGPRVRPAGPPMGPGGVPHPRPLTPSGGRSSPHPPTLSPANGRMSPGPRSMSPGPRSMSPGPRAMSPMGPPGGRARSNSNAPYAGPPRSMSPGPYGGGPQSMAPPPQMGRPRSNSASQVNARRAPLPGPSPMNPNAPLAMPSRKPLPGQAL